MANVKEIQDRIKSIQDTMKITNAMYMISSSKMKKAKKALSDTEPYFFEMQSAIRRILRHVPDIEHAFFDERPEIPKKDRKIGHIIVTADKGLAGAYNHNVIKMAEEQLQWEGKHSLFVLGELGRQYFSKKNLIFFLFIKLIDDILSVVELFPIDPQPSVNDGVFVVYIPPIAP